MRKSDHVNAIRSHEHFDALCAAAGLAVAERRYYNVVFKAVVEDLLLRLYEQRRRGRRRRRTPAPRRRPPTRTATHLPDARRAAARPIRARGRARASPGSSSSTWSCSAASAPAPSSACWSRARPRGVKVLYVASRPGGAGHAPAAACTCSRSPAAWPARGHEVARGGAPRRRARHAATGRRRRALASRLLVAAAPLLPLPRAARRRRASRTDVRPDVVMERYYNFGGEGIAAAEQARGVPGAARGELAGGRPPAAPRRRRSTPRWWCARCGATARRMVRRGDRARGPDPGDRARVRAREDGDRDLGRERRRLLARAAERRGARRRSAFPEGAIAVLFSGSFRPWHGVHVLEDAARRLRASRATLLRARRRRRRGRRATATAAGGSGARALRGDAGGGRRLRHRHRTLRHRAPRASCASASSGRR